MITLLITDRKQVETVESNLVQSKCLLLPQIECLTYICVFLQLQCLGVRGLISVSTKTEILDFCTVFHTVAPPWITEAFEVELFFCLSRGLPDLVNLAINQTHW